MKPGQLFVSGGDLFLRGSPGDVKKVVELVVQGLAIILNNNISVKISASIVHSNKQI